MATASGDSIPLSKVDERVLECAVCHERYKSPKILNCFHSFCEQCLIEWIKANNGKLSCPTCRIEWPLPSGGVTKLRDNTFLNDLMDLISESGPATQAAKCENCKKEASCWCKDCAQYFCTECDLIHETMRLLKGHERITMEEYNKKKETEHFKLLQPRFCDVHPSSQLEFYCDSCQHPVCYKCTVVKHKSPNHDVISTEEALQKYTPSLKKYADELGRDVEKLKKAKEDVGKISKTLRQNHGKVATQIKAAIRETHDTAAAEEHRLLNDLQKQYQLGDKQIQMEQEHLDLYLGNVDSMYSYLTHVLRFGSAVDILSAKKAAEGSHLNKNPVGPVIEETRKLSAYLQFLRSGHPVGINIGNMVNEMLLSTAPTQSLRDFLKSPAVSSEIHKIFRQRKLQATYLVDGEDIKCYGVSGNDVKDATDVIQRSVSEETIPILPQSKDALRKAAWNDLVTYLQEEHPINITQVRQRGTQTVLVTGFEKSMPTVMRILQDYIKLNTVIEHSIPLEAGKVRYIFDFKKGDIARIQRQATRMPLHIEACQRPSMIVIKGTGDDVISGLRELQQLIDNVHGHPYLIDNPLITNLFQEEKGQNYLRMIERNHNCRIDVGDPLKVTMQGKSVDKGDTDSSLLEAVFGKKRAEKEAGIIRDAITLYIFAASENDVKGAISQIEKILADEIVDIIIDKEGISKLSAEDWSHLQENALKLHVKLQKIDTGSVIRLRLQGTPQSVMTVQREVNALLDRISEEERRISEAKMLARNVKWLYLNDEETYEEYEDEVMGLIEKAHLDDKRSVTVDIEGGKYMIDFTTMTEMDMSDRSKVPVRRDLRANSISLPNHWRKMADAEQLKRVLLDVHSTEFQTVATAFMKSLQPYIVVQQIERIQNPKLYRKYMVLKQNMDRKNKKGINNVKLLYHGTAAYNVDKISYGEFYSSFAGKNATSYGHGSYFAVNSSYSASTTFSPPDPRTGNRYVYQAKVLTGEFTRGQQGILVPPSKSGSDPTDLYDSVTDNVQNPSLFVIFNDAQAYPEYLITFR
ncbi:uncharacterized protein LOC144445727 [Glandiceps talaboti]